MGMRHFDVQLIGGMVAARRQHRRDEDRRGQDAHRDAGRRPQRARRQGRPPRHRQRLPGPPRRRVDETDLRRRSGSPGACCRTCSPTRTSSDAYAADVTYGTNSEFGFDYLRDNMATVAGGEGPARRAHRRDGRPVTAHLRDRRRGRQHPHRRGAHAADHLRRARAGRRLLRRVRQARARHGVRQEARGHGPAHEEGVRRRLRLRVRREAQDGRGHRAAASPRRRSSSASTISTGPRTATWSTT